MSFGEVSYWGIDGKESLVQTKRVVYRPSTASDTIRVGDLVCYNADLAADWKEATSNRVTSDLGGGGATTYAEGSQTYNARFLVVEKPASNNVHAFAGVVAKLGPKAGADGDTIEIYPLVDGAVVPVMTDLSVTLNETPLAVQMGQYEATNPVYGGSTDSFRIIGVALETVDRSSTDGLVWMRMSSSGIFGVSGGCGGVSANVLTVGPAATTGDMYGGFLSLRTTATGGTLTGYRFRAELDGAGSALGGISGCWRFEGVIGGDCSAQDGSYQIALGSHLILKTGATLSAAYFHAGIFKIENQDGTPATITSATWIAPIRSELQLDTNDAANKISQMYFASQGDVHPDFWFKAESANACAAQTADTTFTPNYGGTIAVNIAGTTYYIPLLADLD